MCKQTSNQNLDKYSQVYEQAGTPLSAGMFSYAKRFIVSGHSATYDLFPEKVDEFHSNDQSPFSLLDTSDCVWPL